MFNLVAVSGYTVLDGEDLEVGLEQGEGCGVDTVVGGGTCQEHRRQSEGHCQLGETRAVESLLAQDGIAVPGRKGLGDAGAPAACAEASRGIPLVEQVRVVAP